MEYLDWNPGFRVLVLFKASSDQRSEIKENDSDINVKSYFCNGQVQAPPCPDLGTLI